jgi:hypothetical protein
VSFNENRPFFYYSSTHSSFYSTESTSFMSLPPISETSSVSPPSIVSTPDVLIPSHHLPLPHHLSLTLLNHLSLRLTFVILALLPRPVLMMILLLILVLTMMTLMLFLLRGIIFVTVALLQLQNVMGFPVLVQSLLNHHLIKRLLVYLSGSLL